VSALPGRFELVACTVSTRTPVPPVAMYTHISPSGGTVRCSRRKHLSVSCAFCFPINKSHFILAQFLPYLLFVSEEELCA